MRMLLQRALALFSRRRLDGELDAEIRTHIDLLADEYMRRGMTPHDALAAARRAFGGIEPIKEAYRDQRGLQWVEDLHHDVRHAIRGLVRTPGFAVVAVLTLALGIGANAAIFSLLDAVLLKPIPVRDPHALVIPTYHVDGRRMIPFAAYQFRGLRARRDALVDLAAFRPLPVSVTYRGESDITGGQLVSGNYYELLGVQVVLGRPLAPADDRPSDSRPAAVIGYGYWQRRFGGAPSVIGAEIEVNGRPFTIVGVTVPGFLGTEAGRTVDVTVPLSMQPGVFGARSLLTDAMEARWLYLIGRLPPGVTRTKAEAALAVAWDQVRTSRPPSGRVTGPAPFLLLDGSQGLNELRDRFSVSLRVLMALVGLVLVIACANLATLLLARSGARRQEMTLRLALGARRGRLVRQMLTESVLLSTIGGAFGVGLAVVVGDLLVQMLSRGAQLPITLDLSLNVRTGTFTLLTSIAAGIIFGVVPAFRSSHLSIATAARSAASPLQAGTRWSWSRGLIAAQVVLSVLLLVEAGLFTRSLSALRHLDAGFAGGDEVLLASMRTRANSVDQVSRLVELYTQLSLHPGVARARSVTFSMDVPLAGGVSYSQSIAVPGYAHQPNETAVSFNFVGPHFFDTMGIAVSGRDIRAEDDERAPAVAVISQSLARRYFQGTNPIGKHIRTEQVEVEVVGVAADVKYTALRDRPAEMIYLPFLQGRAASGVGVITLALRAARDANETAAALRAAVPSIAPDLMIANLVTLEERKEATLARERIVATLSICFGALALLLGSMGLYGTLSYAVTRRTSELGVRVALGAERSSLIRMVIGESLRPVVAGIVVGLPLALVAGRVSESLLFGIRGTDPLTYVLTTAMLFSSAAGAAFLPARRAASIDPIKALRSE
jgi:predicted permease